MAMNLKEKQDKAHRDQKLLAIGMAVLVTIVTYLMGWDNTGWLMLAVIYLVSVAVVISYELWDEARVRGWMREYNLSILEAKQQKHQEESISFIKNVNAPVVLKEPERETAIIDIIA